MEAFDRMRADSPVSIVIGGSGVVGRAVCRTLASRGVRVGFTFLTNETAANELAAAHPGTTARRLDVRDVPALDRTIDEFAAHFGRIDALINCAAIGSASSSSGSNGQERMDDVGEDGWDAVLAVNTKASFFAVRRLAALMRGRGLVNVVLLGSIDGVKPAPSPVHYAASKAALAGMIKAMAKELGPQGIRVNSVAPGVLEGGLSHRLPDELRREYLKHCGLKRFGRIDEVASLVAWLATENTFVTGQTMILDGAL
jgi:NAD(P)-dependent dehydrogenase (short-subunit alcohol dehydrogenase family)